MAQKTARQLVLYYRRSGGQSQFSSLLELKAAGGRFGALLAWAREHLDAPLTVEDMAEQAGMSSRHFARAFIAETGTTPSKAVERLRIEVARLRVQSSCERSSAWRNPPAFAILSGCAAPSSAPSASRRNRCVGAAKGQVALLLSATVMLVSSGRPCRNHFARPGCRDHREQQTRD